MNSSRNVNDLAAFFAVAREKSFTRRHSSGHPVGLESYHPRIGAAAGWRV